MAQFDLSVHWPVWGPAACHGVETLLVSTGALTEHVFDVNIAELYHIRQYSADYCHIQ